MSSLGVDLFVISLISIFLLGIPAVVKNVWLPKEMEFEEVPDFLQSENLKIFFNQYDQELRSLGYSPFLTITVINLQNPNTVRTYTHPMDPSLCCVGAIGGIKEYKEMGQTYAEWITHYQDGSLLTTVNHNKSSIMKRPTSDTLQEFKGKRRIVDLKQKHDLKSEEFRIRGPLYFQPGQEEKYLKVWQEYHYKFCEVNEKAGRLKFDPASGLYRATIKAALGAICNFLNPLADNFTFSRFTGACFFGFGLPFVGSYYLNTIDHWISAVTGLSSAVSAYSFLVLLYGFAGGVVGTLFKEKSFIWGFLLGYLPCRFLSPLVPGWLVMDLWMAWSAEIVCYFKNKREILFP